ncbi:DEAD/DEAH box helicase [Anaerospora hongkongensis]|uniref:DEAD/DEAH box helicase n=1 Tax=Anaerospora hongkongensis TaxID=244830 RepID=UPI0028A06907|nr:DEAD/DEAH box helicase family protein [Anaerospora hongkongensis]
MNIEETALFVEVSTPLDWKKSKIVLIDNQSVSDALSIDYLYKWTPKRPIFISAQTGSGKNTFIEEVIAKKILKQDGRILILSNRIALSRQEKKRIAKIVDQINPIENSFNSYFKEVEKRSSAPAWLDELEDFGSITIKSYQSVLERESNLADHYDFIIFDECHFFLADSKFNKYTYLILTTILKRYSNSIRLYMTATPDEVLKPILEVECIHIQNTCDLASFRPIGLRKLPNWSFHWEPEYNSYTLVNYSIAEHCKPISVSEYPDHYGGEELCETHETYNNYSSIIYEFKRDYSYINCKYIGQRKSKNDDTNNSQSKFINRCQPILNLIKNQIKEESSANKIEKWLIFVTNKQDGQDLLINIGSEYADYIDAHTKNSEAYVKIYREGKFEKKVLITTSVIDNGINIIDLQVKHVVILVFDKVSFLQMLGRKRIELNQKITLYLMENEEKKLNWKLQKTYEALNQIKNAQNNYKKIIKEIFDLNEFFFFKGYNYGYENLIGFNYFLMKKLECDVIFFKSILQDSHSSLNFDNLKPNQLTYNQYVRKLRCNKIENEMQEGYTFGKKTIIEQLSWLGLESTFNHDNYLKEAIIVSEEEKQEHVKQILDFLELYCIEEDIPNNEKSNFIRQKGIALDQQENFCNNFTQLFNRASSKQDNSNNGTMGLATIRNCLRSLSLPYEIISEQIKLTKNEMKQNNINQASATYWIVKKSYNNKILKPEEVEFS